MAVDIGTSVSKVVVFDDRFHQIAKVQDEIDTRHPQPHFFEQDPAQWWTNVKREIREIVETIDPKDIKGIGVCAQMHAPIFVDNAGDPLTPCLNWPDLRTVAETEEIQSATGLFQPFYTATAPKILWLLRENPRAIRETFKILLPKDFIRMKLSKTFCTDLNDARGTGMFDDGQGVWVRAIVDFLDIDPAKLPDTHPSEEVVGAVTRDAAAETGLAEGTPVITGSSDNLGRALDRTVASAKDLLIYLGTGAMIEYISESGAKPKGTFRSILGVAGTGPQWFKNNFGFEDEVTAQEKGVDTYQILDSDAAELAPGAGGLLFLPHLMGERAFEGRTRSESSNFNPWARGVIFGLSLGHTRKHVFRAILEGAAYHLYLCWERIQKLNPGIEASRIVATGGGAKSRLWRRILADLFELPVYLPKETETGSLAVASLIRVGLGMSTTFEEAIGQIDKSLLDAVEPTPGITSRYRQIYKRYVQLGKRLKPLFTGS
jgi:xylulokinase